MTRHVGRLRAPARPPIVLPEELAPMDAAFFDAPVVALAKALIGTILVHRAEEGVAAGRIVETEAYRGPEDLAAHSSGGRRTRRTEAMFGPPGRAYMFLLYGTSWAFNVVAGPPETPHAILVRAIEPVLGLSLMSARRGVAPERRELTNGPGKLTHALGLDRSHYGANLTGDRLFVARSPLRARPRIGRSARINIDYAGPWIEKKWRFYEKGNAYVSVKPRD
jgi:DNA-3-methyladenine glycosylase